MANYGSLEQRQDLLWHFESADVEPLSKLCDVVHLRTTPIAQAATEQLDHKDFLLESLIAKYEKRQSQIDKINATPLYPNEASIQWKMTSKR